MLAKKIWDSKLGGQVVGGVVLFSIGVGLGVYVSGLLGEVESLRDKTSSAQAELISEKSKANSRIEVLNEEVSSLLQENLRLRNATERDADLSVETQSGPLAYFDAGPFDLTATFVDWTSDGRYQVRVLIKVENLTDDELHLGLHNLPKAWHASTDRGDDFLGLNVGGLVRSANASNLARENLTAIPRGRSRSTEWNLYVSTSGPGIRGTELELNADLLWFSDVGVQIKSIQLSDIRLPD